MNIKYELVGTKTYKKVKIRLYHNKLSLITSTNLISDVADWDPNVELFKRNNIANKSLIQLKINVKDQFNSDYGSGVIVDTQWLQSIVTRTFNRPNAEEKLVNKAHTIFLDDFAAYWLEIESETWTNSRSKVLNNKAIGQKSLALKCFLEFQTKNKLKLKLVDFSSLRIKGYYDYLISKKYSVSMAKKTLADLKFFCRRADELTINVNQDFLKKTVFNDNSTEGEDIYLNESEITDIFNYDFSDNETLGIIRDNFILSLWTGKRISDLQNIDFSNIIGENLQSIDIKTSNLTTVFIHPQVKEVLDKYYGHLPPKIHRDVYNTQIKEICRLCKINTITFGKIPDLVTKRKIPGNYEKYKLVTSHTARRSFATNMCKLMKVEDVARLGGWKDPRMVWHYNKESAAEVAKRASLLFQNI